MFVAVVVVVAVVYTIRMDNNSHTRMSNKKHLDINLRDMRIKMQ